MHNQDQVPTIAELWKEADYLIELTIPHLEGLTNPNNRVNEERRPYYISQLAKCKEKLESLRQQLLERCKEVDDADRDTTKLWVCCDGDRLAIQTPGILEFVGSPKELRELGAACNFWAWELEQRQKENDSTRP